MTKKPNKYKFLTRAGYLLITAAMVTALCVFPGSPASLAAMSDGDYGISEDGEVLHPSVSLPYRPQTLIPVGQTVAISLSTDGIIIVGVSPVSVGGEYKTPIFDSGFQKGDVIEKIDGKSIKNVKELQAALEEANGNPVTVRARRGDSYHEAKLAPAKSDVDGKYRLGAWMRDSISGVGTLTFYDAENKLFAALGHGICDGDSGDLLPMYRGIIAETRVTDITRGLAGNPGELKGEMSMDSVIGRLFENNETGIFGIADRDIKTKLEPIPVGSRSSVKVGPAKILSNIEGREVGSYDIQITKILDQSGTTKNMLITVTDPVLLEKTGGIVQGMSGSPIIQDGQIVGAVTHVLVNDPTSGYGIFIENMLDSSIYLENAA